VTRSIKSPVSASRRFFILGSQRSGTTLLRLILETHSRVRCLDETLAFPAFLDDVGVVPDEKLLGLKLPQITEQLLNPFVCDDRLMRLGTARGHRNTYRTDEPIIFLLRDPLDVVASMVALKGWLITHGSTVLDARLRNDVAFRKRYRTAIRTLVLSGTNRSVAAAALIWRYKTDAGFDYLDRGLPVLLVSYEHLVRHPRVALARICGFLGIDFQETLLGHHLAEHSQLLQSGRTILASRVGRFKNVLSARDIDVVLTMAGESASRVYGVRNTTGYLDAKNRFAEM
jgi:hypothetical protein